MSLNVKRSRVIAEFDNGEILVMTEDGQVQVFLTPNEVLAYVTRLAAKTSGDLVITTLEWRNTPSGFVPPEE